MTTVSVEDLHYYVDGYGCYGKSCEIIRKRETKESSVIEVCIDCRQILNKMRNCVFNYLNDSDSCKHVFFNNKCEMCGIELEEIRGNIIEQNKTSDK